MISARLTGVSVAGSLWVVCSAAAAAGQVVVVALRRIYIGVHFRKAVEDGVKFGVEVANYVFDNFSEIDWAAFPIGSRDYLQGIGGPIVLPAAIIPRRS